MSVIAPPHPVGRGSILTLDREDDRLADGPSCVAAPYDDLVSDASLHAKASLPLGVARLDWPSPQVWPQIEPKRQGRRSSRMTVPALGATGPIAHLPPPITGWGSLLPSSDNDWSKPGTAPTRKRPSHALTGIGRFSHFVLRERTARGNGYQWGRSCPQRCNALVSSRLPFLRLDLPGSLPVNPRPSALRMALHVGIA